MKNFGFRFDTTYRELPEPFFTELAPEVAPSPKLVLLNEGLAQSLGLDFSSLSSEEQALLFAGNRLPDGATPFSQAYAGHQFGHFTMLGDGRAHVWGEHLTPEGARFDVQFKGSGRTPYSRRGDGKAVLGPMLREYIISEAMHHLGVSTTRSLAVVTTGQSVRRERLLPGAVLTRVASSHIRVGTFEFAAATGAKNFSSTLLDYTIKRHYPELLESEDTACALLQAVMEKQAELIVHWMRVGFIHGVMNTDNMALSGETIDYGPCAFMDTYDPNTVFSSIDHAGRYAYANQPRIAAWNLARLAETLLPLIDDDIKQAAGVAEEIINQFPAMYQSKWLSMMGAKLGLDEIKPHDDQLIAELLEWMYNKRADYTHTFYELGKEGKPTGELFSAEPFENWYQRWKTRIASNREQAFELMNRTNPAIIPRNHKVEEALEAATEGHLTPLQSLLDVLTEPYADRESLRPYQELPGPSGRIYQTFCGT